MASPVVAVARRLTVRLAPFTATAACGHVAGAAMAHHRCSSTQVEHLAPIASSSSSPSTAPAAVSADVLRVAGASIASFLQTNPAAHEAPAKQQTTGRIVPSPHKVAAVAAQLKSGALAGAEAVAVLAAYNRAGLVNDLLGPARPTILAAARDLSVPDVSSAVACYTSIPGTRGRHASARGPSPHMEVLWALAVRAEVALLRPLLQERAEAALLRPLLQQQGAGKVLTEDHLTSLSYIMSGLGRSDGQFPAFFALASRALPAAIAALPAPTSSSATAGALCAMRMAVALLRKGGQDKEADKAAWEALRLYGMGHVKEVAASLPAMPQAASAAPAAGADDAAGAAELAALTPRLQSLVSIAWACAISESWPVQVSFTSGVVDLANRCRAAYPALVLGHTTTGQLAALHMAHGAAEKARLVAPDSTPVLSRSIRGAVAKWKAGLTRSARPSLMQTSVARAAEAVCAAHALPKPRTEALLLDGLLVDLAWDLPRTAAAHHRQGGGSAGGVPAKGVVVEVDGPRHFTKGQQGEGPQLDGPTAFKYWLLRSYGWHVVHIPWGEVPTGQGEDGDGDGESASTRASATYAYVEGKLRETPLGVYMRQQGQRRG